MGGGGGGGGGAKNKNGSYFTCSPENHVKHLYLWVLFCVFQGTLFPNVFQFSIQYMSFKCDIKDTNIHCD